MDRIRIRGGNRLYFLLGDGHGQFGDAKEIVLNGSITAFVTGEINRADGLTDIVVGIANGSRAQALVFEGPEGAMRARVEVFDLPAEATALALGQLDGRPENDLVVAAGTDLVIISGRDRKLSLNVSEQNKVGPPIVERRAGLGRPAQRTERSSITRVRIRRDI